MKKALIFVCNLLVFTLSTQAADIYISLLRGSDKNEGTKKKPLQHITTGIAQAHAGDTLHIAEGDYSCCRRGCGFCLDKPLNLIGGYSSDFSKRDHVRFNTILQMPDDELHAWRSMRLSGSVTSLKFKNQTPIDIVVDGLIFIGRPASGNRAFRDSFGAFLEMARR